ncbi:MAG: alkaline phosphatase D family protein [Luteibaculum sp.]
MRKLYVVFLMLLAANLFGQNENEIRQIVYSSDDSTLIFNPDLKPFYHGVASGDPTPNAVIIWTRVTPENGNETITGTYQVATDLAFTNIVDEANFSTTADRDYTVKIDVQNLQPFTFYYYRFTVGGKTSIIGRTKTAPDANTERIRFGVTSCSNFQAGFFNGYRFAAQRMDIDYMLHLGDYIYEYAEGGYGYNDETQRGHEPDVEMTQLEDYRLRYSFYRLDPDLRRVHQLYPFITVWDDHESTNDSYKDGAENHTEGDEGIWEERKMFAAKAYSEWLPIRNPDENNPVKIWRTLKFGNLLDLVMIDTRIWGREEQVGSTQDEAYSDPNRTIMGKDQLEWFKNELTSSTAQWKIIGNQVQIMLVNTAPGQPLLLDPWDGYPAERDTVIRFIRDNEIDNVVFLTGDIHTSWAADLAVDPFTPNTPITPDGYTSLTQAGSVATEFVTPSITSDNFNEITGQAPGTSVPLEAAVMAANGHIRFVELDDHGFMVFDVSEERAQAQWYTGEILERDTTPTLLASHQTVSGSNRVSPAAETFEDDSTNAVNPPEPQSPVTSVEEKGQLQAVVLNAFPNPFEDVLRVQFGLEKAASITIEVLDVNGKAMAKTNTKQYPAGIFEYTKNLGYLPNGMYVFRISSEEGSLSYRIQKK